jgi:clan AA aspartic protease
MTSGYMRGASEALAAVSVGRPDGSFVTVDAVIDTGFTQYLTLPSRTISELGLTRNGTATVVLADGSRKRVPVFKARVRFRGTIRSVDIEESEGDIILGMGMLYGYRLTVDVIEDGDVSIEPLA